MALHCLTWHYIILFTYLHTYTHTYLQACMTHAAGAKVQDFVGEVLPTFCCPEDIESSGDFCFQIGGTHMESADFGIWSSLTWMKCSSMLDKHVGQKLIFWLGRLCSGWFALARYVWRHIVVRNAVASAWGSCRYCDQACWKPSRCSDLRQRLIWRCYAVAEHYDLRTQESVQYYHQ